ncbi:MAG: hypothetical protein ACU84Q_20500 [Gammaproteobacteria bacterium]
MKNPIESAHGHLKAQMSRSIDELNATTTFPFFHIQPDGETITLQTAEEMAPLGGQPFKTKIIECEIIEEGEGTAVLRVVFQRYDMEGNKTIKAKAVWGATKIDGSWTIHWRQFLGQV